MKNLRGFFAFVLLLVAVPCFAAVDAFLKIDGVKGESTDSAHNGWIDVSSFSWGVTNFSGATAAHPGAQGCATNEIHIGVRGSALPQFTKLAATGAHLSPVTLDVNGQRHVLEGAMVTSCQNNLSSGGDRPASANCVMRFARCATHSNAVTTASVLNRNAIQTSAPNASFTLGDGTEDVRILTVTPQAANNVVVVERGASPAFFRNCVAGAHYKKVIIEMRKAGGDSTRYMKFELKDAVVTSVRQMADGSVSLGLKYGMADGSVRPYRDVQ